jgi:hypothetical protein
MDKGSEYHRLDGDLLYRPVLASLIITTILAVIKTASFQKLVMVCMWLPRSLPHISHVMLLTYLLSYHHIKAIRLTSNQMWNRCGH